MEKVSFRKITAEDDAGLANIIRTVMEEYNVARPGTVYTDPTTDKLSAAFADERSACWIVEEEGSILGCGGIIPTSGLPKKCVELVKFYILKEARGRGIGRELLEKCLTSAKEMGYAEVYLESLPEFKTAISLYEAHGFRRIEKRLGNSGHFSCDVFMLLSLESAVDSEEAEKDAVDVCARLIRRLSLARQSCSADRIHKLRLSIKEARAWSKISAITAEAGSHVELPQEITDIFNIAGKLREAQLNMRIARRFKAFNIQPYLGYTHSRMEKRKKKLLQKLGEFDPESLIPLNLQLSSAFARIKEVAVVEKIKGEMQKVIEGEFKVLRTKKLMIELHTLRRQLSVFRWLANAIAHSGLDGNAPEAAEKARHCHNLIGGWHDRKVLERSLHKFLDKKASKGSRKSIILLVKELHDKNKKKAVEIGRGLAGELEDLRKLLQSQPQ